MSDRHRPLPRRVNALTAASRILQPTRGDEPRPMDWHDEAWSMRDTVGELRFAEMWLSNAFSRSRIFAARRPEPGQEPEPVETGPAYELVARLAGGPGGQSALMRSFGPFMMVPGVGYLVGEPKEHAEKFLVVDAEDLRLGVDKETGERTFTIREGEGTLAWRTLPAGTVVTKIFRPHPRKRWQPDSPTRAALPILRELVLLTQHVEATATSRLAGAGVQAFPAEMEFPDGWDRFMDDYVAAMVKPSKNRALAAAIVPFPVKMPAAVIEAFKNGYITYATPFDEKSIELREEAITRLGNAMDMPRQVLTGEQRNHWGDWQIEESGLKLHVEPGLETICEGLTVGFLNPGLEASSGADRLAAAELRRIETETPQGDWLVWYDTADLRVRPDRSQAVQEAYDRFEADGDALRKEQGGSEWKPADPKTAETQTRIWLKLLDHPTLAPLALEKLNMLEPGEAEVNQPGEGPGSRTPMVTGDEEDTGRGLPQRPEQPVQPPAEPPQRAAASVYLTGPDVPPLPEVTAAVSKVEQADVFADVPDYPPGVTPGIAVVAALDGIVHRALERAGRRALNKMPRRNGQLDHDCPAVRLHTCHHIDRVLSLDALFEGAWDRVPEVADRLGEDADALTATVDAYVRVLVRTQVEHTWDGLSEALGVCPCETA